MDPVVVDIVVAVVGFVGMVETVGSKMIDFEMTDFEMIGLVVRHKSVMVIVYVQWCMIE